MGRDARRRRRPTTTSTRRATAVLVAILTVAAFAFAAPTNATAGAGPHPLCPPAETGADACLVYDTGRTTGRPRRLTGASGSDVAAALALPGDLDVLILGEAHDNPHHHRLRTTLLKANAIAMEHVRADQQPGLDAFNALDRDTEGGATVADFTAKLDWAKSGWAKYPFDPLLAAVVAARVPVYAGDPPRDLLRKVAQVGLEALPGPERARLQLDRPLGAALEAAAASEIETAHCGKLPKAAIPRMALAQRYRDAHLADATLRAAAAHGSAVLLTGNGHARTDRGVPWYIRARAPATKVVSVVLAEVEERRGDPETYVPRDPDGRPAADFVILTPTIDREDPCKAFGK